MIVCQKIQSIISTKNLQLLKAVKPKKKSQSFDWDFLFITYLSTFFFVNTTRRIGRLLSRL
jgi:hypothetical protein